MNLAQLEPQSLALLETALGSWGAEDRATVTEIFIIVLTKLNLEYGGSYGDRPAIVLT